MNKLMLFVLLMTLCLRGASVEIIDAETTLPSVSTSNATTEVIGQLGGMAGLVTDITPTYLAHGFAGQISNQSPTLANPGSFSVVSGSSVAINMSGNDDDGDALVWVISSNVSQGTLTGSNGSYSYTPNGGYAGPDSFTISVNDGADNSLDITVSINVTAGPGSGRVINITITPDPGAADMLNITTSATVIHNGASGATSTGNDPNQLNSFIFILAGGT